MADFVRNLLRLFIAVVLLILIAYAFKASLLLRTHAISEALAFTGIAPKPFFDDAIFAELFAEFDLTSNTDITAAMLCAVTIVASIALLHLGRAIQLLRGILRQAPGSEVLRQNAIALLARKAVTLLACAVPLMLCLIGESGMIAFHDRLAVCGCDITATPPPTSLYLALGHVAGLRYFGFNLACLGAAGIICRRVVLYANRLAVQIERTFSGAEPA